MKLIIFFFSVLVTIIIISCNSTDSVVGSNNDSQIPGLSFIVDTTYLDLSGKILVAKGTVKNNGSSTVTSPWYVEAQFFTDNTLNTKLGGNNTQIGVPISRGQSTFWTISFSSTNVDVTKYPHFAVGDLRGIYK